MGSGGPPVDLGPLRTRAVSLNVAALLGIIKGISCIEFHQIELQYQMQTALAAYTIIDIFLFKIISILKIFLKIFSI